jgi:small multidrug resistance pump
LRASQDHSAWLIVVVAGYVGSFVLLTMVLRAGMAVGVAYGIWGALGTAATAVLVAAIFGDPFTWPIAAGIGLIIAGVLLVEFGSRQARADEP